MINLETTNQVNNSQLKEIDINPLIEILSSHFQEEFTDKQIELSLLITTDEHIQELNKLYRGIDKPTNVLSFPNNDNLDSESFLHLGDIVISEQTLLNEIKNQSKTLISHYNHMFLHGFLHLIGYDHIKEQDAQNMEQLEVEILKKLNINNPYI